MDSYKFPQSAAQHMSMERSAVISSRTAKQSQSIPGHVSRKVTSLPRFRPFCFASSSNISNSSSSTTNTPTSTTTPSGASTSRRSLMGLAAALSTSFCIQQQQVAWSKPALLDLPACNRFKDAGAIKFCELQQGSGDSPLAGDLIVVDYTARAVATGEVYDGSRNFKFTVGNGEVIPGWEEGILGNDYIPAIKEGGSRTLLIPPALAYGAEGDGCLFGLSDNCRIPPNSPVEITFKYRGLGY